MLNYDFSGKTAFVTGGASGIGLAAATAFAQAGAQVAIADIVPETVGAAAETLRKAGHVVEEYVLDVADEKAVEDTVARIERRFGRLDYAINNAGISSDPLPVTELSGEKWRRVCDVNLSSVFYCMKAEIAAMLRGGGGAIVNTASVAALIGGYNMSAYIATKHGLIGLTKAAATEYAAKGVRVNAVCPGFIETPFMPPLPPVFTERLLFSVPAGRAGKPEEVAGAMMWLCSDGASYVNGHALAVDGAASLGTAGTRFDDLM
jgi:NAD(P)-dependent dehydrogenase (short-subunit alcohol dehydrogenase family)